MVKSTFSEFKKRNAHATVLYIEKLETRLDIALYRTYFFLIAFTMQDN